MVLSAVVDILLARVEYILLISYNKFVKQITPLILELMFVYFHRVKNFDLSNDINFPGSRFCFIFLLANCYSSP